MDRKTSVAAAVLAGVLVTLFSQAYMTKIERINEKNQKTESSAADNSISISINVDGVDTKKNSEKNNDDEVIADENPENNAVQISTSENEPISNESFVTTIDMNGQTNIETTTEEKSILDRANEKKTEPQKKFNIIDNYEDTTENAENNNSDNAE